MPELPEVEVTRIGIKPHIEGKTITGVKIIDGRLRKPVSSNLPKILKGQTVISIDRRGKYILLEMEAGYLILHLGMTGTLRVLSSEEGLKLHDRVTFEFGLLSLRFHDPRKFGLILWHSKLKGPVYLNSVFNKMGLEPFSPEFSGNSGSEHLYVCSRGRKVSVKQFLLAGHAVVGVGNIYCSESLFESKIHPAKIAANLSRAQCTKLANAIRLTLDKAIHAGGSSLRDFVNSEGNPGHFMMQTKVYGRQGEFCVECKSSPIRRIVQGQRSTYYCISCQKR